MKKNSWSGVLALLMIVASAAAANPALADQTATKEKPVKIDVNFALKATQISDDVLSNDDWLTGLIDLEEIITLPTDTSLQFNLTFDKLLELDDGFLNGNESIHIDVQGVGGVGGAPNNKADFEFLFTGVEGGPLLKNPLKGTVTIGALNGHVDFDQSVDLINGGKVTFKDLHLTLTNKNTNDWNIGKVGVGVDADDIKIVNPKQANIELKILQTVLRRQLVQTVKVAYCQSASPSAPRCRA